MKKRFEDPKTREKQREHLTNIRKQIVYKPLTEEQRKARSEANKGKFLGGKSACAVAVDQYTKDGQFVRRWDSMKDAERAGMGLAVNISKVCMKKPHCYTSGGFVWRYANEPF